MAQVCEQVKAGLQVCNFRIISWTDFKMLGRHNWISIDLLLAIPKMPWCTGDKVTSCCQEIWQKFIAFRNQTVMLCAISYAAEKLWDLIRGYDSTMECHLVSVPVQFCSHWVFSLNRCSWKSPHPAFPIYFLRFRKLTLQLNEERLFPWLPAAERLYYMAPTRAASTLCFMWSPWQAVTRLLVSQAWWKS